MSEEPFLFADTLAENLLLGGDGDDAELRAALHAAAADDVLDGLAGGLDGTLGDRGLRCRAGSASVSRWRVRWSRRRACWCSTTRSAR